MKCKRCDFYSPYRDNPNGPCEKFGFRVTDDFGCQQGYPKQSKPMPISFTEKMSNEQAQELLSSLNRYSSSKSSSKSSSV